MSELELQKSLADKLTRVMHGVRNVAKAGENAHFRFRYARVEDITALVSEELYNEGVAFEAEMVKVEQTGNKTIAYFNFSFVDSATGFSKPYSWAGESNDSGDKGLSKACAFAKKTFLLTFFLMTASDEIDPDSGSDETVKPLLNKSQLDWLKNKLKEVDSDIGLALEVLDMSSVNTIKPIEAQNVYLFFKKLKEAKEGKLVVPGEPRAYLLELMRQHNSENKAWQS